MSSFWLVMLLSATALSRPAFSAVPIDPKVLQIRDPFKRPVIRVTKEAPKSELEMFAVGDFKLVGVATGPGVRKSTAVVLAPNSKTYVISEGMKIGTNKGFVARITAEVIFVREKSVNVLGQEENVDLEIHMQ